MSKRKSCYVIGGTKDYLYVGHTGWPNGSCISGAIGMNIGSISYENEVQDIKNNFDNLQIENIPNGQLFIGISKPGQCGGILHHTALFRHELSSIEISLEGDDRNDTAVFNQMLSTFHFSP